MNEVYVMLGSRLGGSFTANPGKQHPPKESLYPCSCHFAARRSGADSFGVYRIATEGCGMYKNGTRHRVRRLSDYYLDHIPTIGDHLMSFSLQNLSTFAEGGVYGAEERGERVRAVSENFRGGPPCPFGYNETVHADGTALIRAGGWNVPVPRFCLVRR